VFNALVGAGLLQMEARKTLAYGQHLEFAQRHILTAEVSTRSRRDERMVRSRL
jgi:hypothetical protein